MNLRAHDRSGRMVGVRTVRTEVERAVQVRFEVVAARRPIRIFF